MHGTARGVERAQERGKTVLRFVLEDERGDVVPLEMRGDEIRGILRDNDRIEVPAGTRRDQHGLSPQTLRNKSTNSEVIA